MDGDKVVMHLKQQLDISIRHEIKIPINHHQSILPIISNTACTKKELETIGSHLKSEMVSFNSNLIFSDYWYVEVDEFKYEFNCYSKMCCTCVGVEENVNLTNAQKELLLWHLKLGISIIIYRNSWMYMLQRSHIKNIS